MPNIETLHILLIINFAFIGLLPQIFFLNNGKLNLKWWMTALPFYIDGAYLIALFWVSDSSGITRGALLVPWLDVLATLLSITSVALIAFTLGTHRRSISLWHQDNDAPASIVTYGAYSRVRHPFYSSFILALLATCVYAPAPISLAALGYGFIALSLTARREESRLLASEFGAEYGKYLSRTGRFFPRLTPVSE